jgi:NAD(P)-dependent dehydrogenase (short-subunit alcohol dehydrogenase family)
MHIDLSDQVHIITGAGRGIGKETARLVAESGGIPILVARSVEQVEEAAAQLVAAGHRAEAFAADITDAARTEQLVKHVRGKYERIDGLVNNAATNYVANLVMSKEDEWRRVFELNVFAVYRLTRLCLRQMIRAKSGRVVNVSSVSGKVGAAYTSAYAASKGAVDAFTRSIAREVAKIGITVNAVCPWHVETEMLREGMGKRGKLFGQTADEYMAHIAETNPQQRIMQPEEVAGAIVYLLSSQARGLTGQAINVCGGMVMGQ